MALAASQVRSFIEDGVLRIDRAFPLSLDRAEGDYSAVELAIREALAEIT
jgi:hypothetical protein